MRVVGRQVEVTAELLNIREIDLRLSGDHQLLPSAVDAGRIERLDVINGGYVVGRELVIAPGGGVMGTQGAPLARSQTEVIEPVNGADHTLESRRNGWLYGIGKVQLAFRLVVMNGGGESCPNLARRAAEGNGIAPAGDGLHGELLLLQPRNDLSDVVLAQPEPIGVFLRS